MKVRDSGMPNEELWEQLFDVGLILARLGIDASLADVTELGCGHGTFTIPVARRICGTLHTYDIDEAMVARTRERAADAGLANVEVGHRNVLLHGFRESPGSQDACLLFNILHHEEPVALFTAAAGIVRTGGLVFAIHWRHDAATPRGPDLSIRPRPEEILAWAAEVSRFGVMSEVLDLPPWHFGLVLPVAC